MFSTVVSTDQLAVNGWTKLSWITNKRGEATGLKTGGIQSRPPPIQPTPRFTSLRFGYLEKLKDRSKVPLPSTPEDDVSINISRGRIGEGARLTTEGDVSLSKF